ncbi:MAG: LCP family protein [Clostridia bacterium]|nr:LCP family protein [Clostridia bacterium]
MKTNNQKKITKPKNSKQKSFQANKTPMYIILGVICFLLVLTLGLASAFSYINPQKDDENPFNSLQTVTDVNKDDTQKENISKKSPDGRNNNMYNLLLVGKDYWSGSTDVIMIVSINTNTDEISVLQVPRDSTVECGVNENYGKRVNAIFAYSRQEFRRAAANTNLTFPNDPVMEKLAPIYRESLKSSSSNDAKKHNNELLDKMGLEYLKETLKRTFCIAIDGYVMVDVSGFRNIVDVLGGVEVDVPMDMHYDDPEQNLYIHINKGLQVLDGKKAEGFVRYRYGYVDGDIGRVNAQKIFVSALAKKVLSFSTITKLQPIIETCLEYTTTNLSITDVLGYAKILLGVKLNSIKFYTCPGEAYRASSGAWYYSLYMNENLELINAYFNDYDRQVTPEDVTLHEIVRDYNISYGTQGITAEDIENNLLDVQHSPVTYGPVDVQTSVTTNENELPEESINQETEQNTAESEDAEMTEENDAGSEESEENADDSGQPDVETEETEQTEENITESGLSDEDEAEKEQSEETLTDSEQPEGEESATDSEQSEESQESPESFDEDEPETEQTEEFEAEPEQSGENVTDKEQPEEAQTQPKQTEESNTEPEQSTEESNTEPEQSDEDITENQQNENDLTEQQQSTEQETEIAVTENTDTEENENILQD